MNFLKTKKIFVVKSSQIARSPPASAPGYVFECVGRLKLITALSVVNIRFAEAKS
jgi:hypothetical protein